MKTIKQKIEDLTFADLIKKLKDILSNYSSKFESITGRISTLESNASSGGGGSETPNLEQVLEAGNQSLNGEIIIGVAYDRGAYISPTGVSYFFDGAGSALSRITYTTSNYYSGAIEMTVGNTSGSQVARTFIMNDLESTGSARFALKKYTGNDQEFVLATTDDILNIGKLLIPTFTDNATAITGGLKVNELYKTSTGEIRIVV